MNAETSERRFTPAPGLLLLALFIAAIGFAGWLFVQAVLRLKDVTLPGGGVQLAIALVTIVGSIVGLCGLFVVNPNEARAMVLFGVYKGTVFRNGFWWANPFFSKKRVSLRARNLAGEKLKVNDKAGNPIEIGVVVVWRVKDTFRALFEVDDYQGYVQSQSEAAVRQLAGTYPYDAQIEHDEHDETTVSLRGGREQVNGVLEKALEERLGRAGIEVIEARLAHLAYAPEIAGAMLQRQQANAIVAARTRIVDGAVGMVHMALKKLAEEKIIELDGDRRAAMVSNLLVVLCGHEGVHPVVNAGSLYS